MNTNEYNKNNFILSGGPDLPIYNENSKSLGEFLIKKLKQYNDNVLLINGNTNAILTASDLLKQSIRVAHSLRFYGIKTGDVISICSENSFEFLYIMYGTILCGAVINPINVSYTEDEFLHIFNLSQPKIIFASMKCVDQIVTVTQNVTYIEKIICIEKDILCENKFLEMFDDFINNQEIQYIDDFHCYPVDMENTVACIMCSSGTTGLSKGVEITQFNLFSGITQFFGKRLENISYSNVTVLSVLPWYHIYGSNIAMATTIFLGNTIIFLNKFKPDLFLKCIELYKINTAYLVPSLMVFLAKSPLVANYDLSSLKIVWCGSAPLTEEILKILEKRTQIKTIRQGYGLTECTLATTAQNDVKHKLGSVGELLPGVMCKVRCLKTNRCLGPNKEGELLFKCRSIMKGYVRDDVATRATIDEDGWLSTGDIGYYDIDGEFFIVDRLKDLIKYKGFQVPPAEIENILLTHPSIINAAVIGIPDEMAGELPCAFVVKRPNELISEKDIIDFVASKISYTKRLYGGVRFVDDLPKTAIGKVIRRNLRKLI